MNCPVCGKPRAKAPHASHEQRRKTCGDERCIKALIRRANVRSGYGGFQLPRSRENMTVR